MNYTIVHRNNSDEDWKPFLHADNWFKDLGEALDYMGRMLSIFPAKQVGIFRTENVISDGEDAD